MAGLGHLSSLLNGGYMKKNILIISLFSYFFFNPVVANNNSLNQDSVNYIMIADGDLPESVLKDLQAQNSSTWQKLFTTMSVAPKELLKIAENVNQAVNAIANNIDVMLTKKGAIKTLVVSTPIFMLYCYFFPPHLVKNLINYIIGSTSQSASEIVISTMQGIRDNDNDIKLALKEVTREFGELQGIYNINYEIGETAGLWQGLWDSPVSTITLLTTRFVNMAMSSGVPFMAALVANNYLKKN